MDKVKSIKDIYKMLDLFYALKHMYDRLNRQDERKRGVYNT